MGKQIIARGQATIVTQKDSYTINQSVGEYVFTALTDGTIQSAITVVSTIKVMLGNDSVTDFTIGNIDKPPGFAAINVDNAGKTITYNIAANTTTLADNGTILIPVIIESVTYTLSFKWAKSKAGVTGEDTYSLQISSSNGQIFKNGVVHSTLTAHVYRGGMDITGEIPPDWFDWKRSSLNPKSDAEWNSVKRTGSVLEITEKDVERKAVFDCVVHLENIKENFLDIFPRALYLDESNKFSQNVQVYSNIEWSISQLPAWLTVDHVNGSENKTIVNAEKNHYIGRTERAGTVTITGLGIQTPQTYKVIQEGVPEFISIGNGTDITIDDVGGEIVISGKSNSEKLLYFWIGDGENGVLSSNYTAGGKTTANGQAIEGDPGAIQEFDWSIRVNLPANYTDSQIIRTLKVTNGGIVSAQIAIRQNFKETTLSIVPNEVMIPEDLSAISINVISNTDWEIL